MKGNIKTVTTVTKAGFLMYAHGVCSLCKDTTESMYTYSEKHILLSISQLFHGPSSLIQHDNTKPHLACYNSTA